MPRVTVSDLGSFGLIEDVQDFAVHPQAWTTVLNARMNEGGASRILGEVRSLGTDVTPWTRQPFWLFHAKNLTGEYWVGCADTAIYARGIGPTFTERTITRAAGAYTATEALKWNGGMFQEFLVVNNSIDQPQYWDLGAGLMLDFNNLGAGADKWPANMTCRSIRGFNKFLVALNVTKGGVAYPHLVKWSHPANPGSLPTSWNEADPTKDAGEYPLTDSEAPVVDGLKLGQNFFVYKGDSIYRMRFVGGQDIFAFDPMIGTQGLLAPNCVAKFGSDLEMHVAIGTDDLYVHNGQAINSIVEKKLKKWLFNQIDVAAYATSFVVAYEPFHEIWICFPETGAQQPTLALIWNWKDESFTVRELCRNSTGAATRTSATVGTPCVAVGTVTTADTEPWSGDAGTWDADTTLWAGKTFSPIVSRLMMVDRSGQKYTYLIDQGYDFDGTIYTTTCERVGLAVTGQDFKGAYVVDTDSEKLCQGLWPRLKAPVGTVVYFSIGTQMKPDDPVTWSSEIAYIVGTTEFCDFYESGRIFSVRMRSAAASAIALVGYDIDISVVGKF